jgi:alkanesulfonate monooxygenase SsuD/methylene tetrahydromethanopterin reductase-like flavin-dependent oxidoreductase (luciferase family)
VAAELEELGYSALWFLNRPDSFELAADLLDATRRVGVVTGIVSIWERPAAQAYQALTDAHPGRFLLGLGVSHAHLVDPGQPGQYARPVTRMRDYLDQPAGKAADSK